MELKNRIGAAKLESGVKLERTMEEIRITTDTLKEERTAQIEPESHDPVVPRNDARLFIEKKKRKRYAAEIASQEEKMMREAREDDEDGTLRSSHIAPRNQTTKVNSLEHERDAALVSYQNALRHQTEKGVSLERELAAALVAVQGLKAERDELIREKDPQIWFLTNANVRLKSELDNAWIARQDAQARCEDFRLSEFFFAEKCKELEMMKNAAETAVLEEKMRSEFLLADERRLRISLENDRKKKDRESLARVRSMEADKQKLVAELDKKKQTADAQIRSWTSDKTLLPSELDAARIAIQSGKTENENKLAIALLEKENVEKKLALVEGERDTISVASAEQKAQLVKLDTELATALTKKENLEKKFADVDFERDATRKELDRQKALVETERNDKLKLQKALTDLMVRTKKLEYDVSHVHEEAAEDTRKLVTAHKNEFDEAKTDIVRMKRELDDLEKEKNRLEKLEYDASLIQEEDVRQLEQANWDIIHLQNSLREQKNQVERLNYDVSRIQVEAAEDKRKLEQAHSDIVHLEKSLREEKNRLEKLDNIVRRILEEAVEDERQLVQAHLDIFHLKTELESLRKERNRLKNQVSRVQEEAAVAKRKLDSFRAEKALLEKREYFLQEEAAEAKRKLEQAQKELDEIKTDMVQLKGELNSAWDERNRLIKLEYDVTKVQEEAAEERRMLVQAHRTEIDEGRTTIDHLKMELGLLREEEGKLEKLEYFIQQEAAEAKRKLVQAHKNELDEVKTQMVQLTREIAFLTGEKNRLEQLGYHVCRIQEEAAEDKRQLVQAHKHELDAARTRMVDLKTEIDSLTWEKGRLEKLAYDVSRIQEEAAEDKRQLMQAHKHELDENRAYTVNLKLKLESLTEEKNRVVSDRAAIEKTLDEEKEKTLCQICLESPRDTISLPCSHFHYCFSCLERHRQRTNTCPSCRTPINATFRFNMCS